MSVACRCFCQHIEVYKLLMNWMWLVLILVAACPFSLASHDESNLAELTTSNFDAALMQHSLLLVDFYSPDCEKCKAFEPVYASLTTAVKELNSSVLVAKVDVEAALELAERFEVEYLPSLRLFVNGKHESQYPGFGPTREGVLQWVQKQVVSPTREVRSAKELQAAKASRVMMLGYFNEFDGETYDAYHQLALREYGIEFLKTTDKALAAELGITGAQGFAITRNYSGHDFATAVFQEQAAPQGDATFLDQLEYFLSIEKLPDYLEYSEESTAELAALVKEVEIGYHMYVAAPAAELRSDRPLMAAVREAGKKLRGRFLVMTHELQPGGESPLYSFLKVDSHAEHPQIVGAEVVRALKYRFTGADITAAALAGFADAVVAGTAVRVLSSAPPPDHPVDPQDNVTVVVGSTFEAVTRDPTKDVLVEVYANWCGYCQSFAPTYSRLATLMQGIDSVVVAKVAKDENEHADLDSVELLPTLLFYAAEAGAEAVPISVEGASDLQSLVNFLEANAKVEFTPPDISQLPQLEDEDDDEDDEYEDEEQEETE